MRGRLSFIVAVLAVAVLIASESQSEAGRRHRSGCGSCATVSTGCATACDVSAPCDAAASCPVAVEKEAVNAGAQPSNVVDATKQQPVTPVVSSPSSTRTYFAGRRALRRTWR